MSQVAQGDGPGISGVGWLRSSGKSKKLLHHHHHLFLVGPTISSHGGFDLGGRVLNNMGPTGRCLRHSNSRDMSNRNCSIDVVLKEDFLDRQDLRIELIHEFDEFVVDLGQARGKILASICSDYSNGIDLTSPATAGFDNGVATSGESWVDSEYEHLYDASASTAPLCECSSDNG